METGFPGSPALPVHLAHTISQRDCVIVPADPEPGWATRFPDRALAFIFVSPRDCTALDEIMRF